MRCLGRVVSLLLALLLLGGAWLYRGEIKRYVQGIIDPISLARRTGEPSNEAAASAARKIEELQHAGGDSVVLGASEVAALLREDQAVLGHPALDSVRIELGDRQIRVSALVNTNVLPKQILQFWPGTPADHEEIIAEGKLSPARSGAAEWDLSRVAVKGLPLPSDLVSRVIAEATGRGSDGRLILTLPSGVEGFRVRPEGMTLYRSGGT